MMKSFPMLMRVSIIMFAISSSIALAQTSYFEVGYQAYLRNQLKLAEGYFTKALGASKTKSDSAYILKFIGITRYMSGNIQGAKEMFAQAYISDNSLMVYEEEVLDTSVITFYLDVRRQVQAILRQKQMRSKVSTRDQAPPPKGLIQPKPKTTPKYAKRSRSRETIKNSKLSWKDLLPLGVNHGYRKKYVPAALMATAQIASLYLFYQFDQDITKEKNENEKAKQSLTGEALDGFIKENNSYIKTLETNQTISAIAFPLLWGASITYAILDSNATLRAKQRKNRRVKPRYKYSKANPSWSENHKPKMNLGLFPSAKGPLVYLSMNLP